MFSGIVQEIGIIEKLEYKNNILEISVLSKTPLKDLKLGDSIAIDGCCQTVTETNNNSFKVQATQETIEKTNFKFLQKGSKINLEPSLKLGDNIGGHFVTGHIDTTGKVSDINTFGENKIVKIIFPSELSDFIASKGSVTVNGVSLTVIELKNCEFSFTLIPFTRDNTNLGFIKINDPVNLEIDIVSRYLVNYLRNNKETVRGRI
ncbi:MAG: riboflavin synthase subunit alpha [Candidatus Melainabacteria bacterium RIFCSPHIGHO2_02_FULL_34_12]|nr:MAG: riboflavin synthase subunit alpha [Candidatus Melainabacteria bacterium RIFCSPHIGHO2_02_FULL_34_12]